jgi:YceI-like domain
MSGHAFQHAADYLRRGFGWRLWAIALACLTAVACVETSLGPWKSRPTQRPAESPALPSGVLGFIPATGSRVELQGMSPIGAWSSRSTDVRGEIVLDADAAALNALFDRIQSVTANGDNRVAPDFLMLSVRSTPIGNISVPILSLHGDSRPMDHDMQIALKAGAFPSIEYAFQQLQQVTLQWNAASHETELKLSLLGKLTLAGQERPMTMDLIVKRDPRGHFLAHAQTAMRMTDFGVTPPGKIFGLIKAGDQVVVIFDLDLVPADHPPATRPAR